jgi:hypothetical protein
VGSIILTHLYPVGSVILAHLYALGSAQECIVAVRCSRLSVTSGCST